LQGQSGVIFAKPLAVACILPLLCFSRPDEPKAAKQGEGPRIVIESFAPVSAVAVGMQPVLLVGTVRNVGREASAADTWTARVSTLAGLEYTEGDTRPKIPALEPNGTATFRWKLAPSNPDSPLIASLSVEAPGRMPESSVLTLQRFAEWPRGESAAVPKEASASAGRSAATLENAAIRARVYSSDSGVPCLVVSSRTATGWRRVGTTIPLAAVMSGESGQRPWWEVFRAESMRAVNAKGSATLNITGGIGLRWRGTVQLTVRTGSSVIDARLLLSPLRSMRVSRVRLLPFYVGDDSFGSAAAETLGPEEGAPNASAVRWGAITIGANWLDGASLGTWRTESILSPTGADYRLLGAEWVTDGPALALAQGSLLEIRARLFALTPSAAVTDARRVAAPARFSTAVQTDR
jgi:hypothetical protein